MSYPKHKTFMHHAIQLAKKGFPSPNPLVGAVLVRNNEIIGEGFHAYCGGPHAEREAFSNCTQDPAGADLYVTLEPCCHHGRTPPCTDIIVEKGIRRVFIGSRDPNPCVSGKGAALLRTHGIEVIEDVLKDECDALNPVFFHYITKKIPYAALKYAMTADGKIATVSGASKWITGEEARAHVHQLRHQYRSILVGIGTVLADDPLLNCRMENGRNPIRILCDTHLRLPLESQICKTAQELETIVAYCHGTEEKLHALTACGITLWKLPETDGHVCIHRLLQKMAEAEIDSVLVEGGAEIHYAFLKAGLAQKLYAYVAPKIFGGTSARTPVGGAGILLPSDAFRLKQAGIHTFGEDVLLEYDIVKGETVCSQD